MIEIKTTRDIIKIDREKISAEHFIRFKNKKWVSLDSLKEVFDEMDNTFRDLKSRYPTITEQQILNAFEKIKKRHLSTFQKEKLKILRNY